MRYRARIDPGNMSMDWFRGEVQKDLDGVVFPGELPVQHRAGPAPIDPPIVQPPVNKRTDRQLLEEIWDQLCGPGGNGWPQFGGKTVVDYLVEIGRFATELHSQLDELRAMQSGSGPNGQPGAPAKKAAAKKVPAKKAPAKKAAKKSAANRSLAKKSAAKKTTTAKKSAAKKTTAKKSAAKMTAKKT